MREKEIENVGEGEGKVEGENEMKREAANEWTYEQTKNTNIIVSWMHETTIHTPIEVKVVCSQNQYQ